MLDSSPDKDEIKDDFDFTDEDESENFDNTNGDEKSEDKLNEENSVKDKDLSLKQLLEEDIDMDNKITTKEINEAFLEFFRILRKKSVGFDYKESLFNVFCEVFLIRKALMFHKLDYSENSFYLRVSLGVSEDDLDWNYKDLDSYFLNFENKKAVNILNIRELEKLNEIISLSDLEVLDRSILISISNKGDVQGYILILESDFF